jgi:membrane protein YdbS with pleckstrin-like domain
MSHRDAFYMDEGEHLLLKIRKHWFLIFVEFKLMSLLLCAPYITLILFPAISVQLPVNIILILLSIWTLICAMGIANLWTNYYLDLWVVTNKRIVIMEQRSLFHREVTTMRMERIQDTTVNVSGFWASFFNYGDLTVNTAGDHMKVQTFEGIPDPDGVKGIVIEQIDAVTDHKSKLDFSGNKNPTQGE